MQKVSLERQIMIFEDVLADRIEEELEKKGLQVLDDHAIKSSIGRFCKRHDYSLEEVLVTVGPALKLAAGRFHQRVEVKIARIAQISFEHKEGKVKS